jgi:hypothetical protein
MRKYNFKMVSRKKYEELKALIDVDDNYYFSMNSYCFPGNYLDVTITERPSPDNCELVKTVRKYIRETLMEEKSLPWDEGKIASNPPLPK